MFFLTFLFTSAGINSLRPCNACMRQKTNHHGSDNNVSPGQRQAITWSSAGIVSFEPRDRNFSQFLIEIHTFSFEENAFENIFCKMASICLCLNELRWVKGLMPKQNGRHFTDDIFNCIFFNENVWIPIQISLKFVPKGPINNIPALVQIMAWWRPGDKPLSEPMMVRLPTHICVTRPPWVKAVPGAILT